MADAIIDLIGPEDLPLICSVVNQIYRPAQDVASFRERFRNRRNVLQFLARIQDEPVGIFLGYEYEPKTFYAWFYGVLPDFRKQGIGTQLMEAVHEWAGGHGYETIRFECHNRDRAMLHLAISQGYDIIGVQYDTDRADNKVIFEHKIHLA